MQQITHFLHNAMRVVGSGCKAVTKYVTGPVCTAMGIVPKGTEVGACGVFTVGYEVCVAIAEGTRTYCNTLGFSLPGTPAVDEIICKAVHAAGKK
ncbi:hypothetical protein SNE40_021741 [Patella caerulea]|uniref:Uncharacterized protein n=1 Tax=Patella caerulea TaxID=87958 RepID=A0AAN8G4S3_PATCE